MFGDLTLFAVLASQTQAVGLTLGAVGVMLGIHQLIRIPGNPLAGQPYDRWGHRPLFLAGMVLALLDVGLGAAGSGAVLATLAARVGDLTPPGREGTVMGMYAAAGDVGSTAGRFLAFALAPIIDL